LSERKSILKQSIGNCKSQIFFAGSTSFEEREGRNEFRKMLGMVMACRPFVEGAGRGIGERGDIIKTSTFHLGREEVEVISRNLPPQRLE
jgi:hypothetical protein